MLAIIAASEGLRSSRTSCVPAASKIFLTETTEEVDRFVYADPDAQSAQGTAG